MNLTKLKVLKESLQLSDLKILCTGELEVDYQNLLELQLLEDGRSLKQTDDDKILKLAESLLRFGIVNNLQIWIDKDKNHFCFDAHHRQKALTILSEIGLNIPPLPATRCLAETKNDAKKLLLIKESRTSWVNVEVVPDYIKEIGFSFEVAEAVIDLPEFSWGAVNTEEEIPDFSPKLPTDKQRGLMNITFVVSDKQFETISLAIKEKIKNNSLLDDPVGLNENNNGNALYSICKTQIKKC